MKMFDYIKDMDDQRIVIVNIDDYTCIQYKSWFMSWVKTYIMQSLEIDHCVTAYNVTSITIKTNKLDRIEINELIQYFYRCEVESVI